MDIKIDSIIRSRRRTIALVITSDARLVIRAPQKVPEGAILEFVRRKSDWIARTRRAMELRQNSRKIRNYADGEGFMYLGEELVLKYCDEARTPQIKNGTVTFPVLKAGLEAGIIKEWYRREARKVLAERARFYSLQAGISYRSIKITSAQRRWGSCGPSGTLNFALRLVMAPIEVIDYVVAHELAHIRHRDHSGRFWAEVGRILPGYEKHRRWLKMNHSLLEL